MYRMLSSVLLVLTVVGCQTVPYQGQARNVVVKPQKEGVISIPVEYRDEDRQKAESVMSKNCQPYRPEILQEGEAVVGTKTDTSGKETDRASSEAKVGSLFGIPLVTGEAAGKNVSSSSSTVQIKEWHISYKCDQKKKSTVQ